MQDKDWELDGFIEEFKVAALGGGQAINVVSSSHSFRVSTPTHTLSEITSASRHKMTILELLEDKVSNLIEPRR